MSPLSTSITYARYSKLPQKGKKRRERDFRFILSQQNHHTISRNPQVSEFCVELVKVLRTQKHHLYLFLEIVHGVFTITKA